MEQKNNNFDWLCTPETICNVLQTLQIVAFLNQISLISVPLCGRDNTTQSVERSTLCEVLYLCFMKLYNGQNCEVEEFLMGLL